MVTNILILVEIICTVVMGTYFFNALKGQKSNKIIIDKESKKEMEKLTNLKKIKLTIPLTEKSRPTKFEEIIGQKNGIEALKAAICGPNPQNVIIYGPPGVGKTAAARLVLEYAKTKEYSPFKSNAKFVEIDATTIRFDERGIADPLIGSVHDPIYQGAGSLGVAGIPQPKPGAVTKAHGGILFIDEIGELHPIEMNKLLKVLEDRKVFLDSSYYSSSNNNIPLYIREIFDNGLPADFRLIGATTRKPEEISPAIRSRCVEIFFKNLLPEEMEMLSENAILKSGFNLEKKAKKLVGQYASNGRDAINLVQLALGIAINDNRKSITKEDVEVVIENGQYSPRMDNKINENPQIGYVNGLAVYGANIGTMMEIEASAIRKQRERGEVKITGIIEEEEITTNNKKVIRKSTAMCSLENVLTVLEKYFKIPYYDYDIHVNFPGGVPVDGPSAGVSITVAIYSAIKEMAVDNKIAMTGEVSLLGKVKPVGGVSAKINAAIKAGAERIIIPKENWNDNFLKIKGAKIFPVENIIEVIELSLMDNERTNERIDIKKKDVVLSAQSYKEHI